MKTDKELAVELASAYISAWFSRDAAQVKPLSGEMLNSLVQDAYNAVRSLEDAGT